jgi:S1-C subfamily serine protease
LNTKPIDSTATLRAPVDSLKAGDPVVLQVKRQGEWMFVSFEME